MVLPLKVNQEENQKTNQNNTETVVDDQNVVFPTVGQVNNETSCCDYNHKSEFA